MIEVHCRTPVNDIGCRAGCRANRSLALADGPHAGHGSTNNFVLAAKASIQMHVSNYIYLCI